MQKLLKARNVLAISLGSMFGCAVLADSPMISDYAITWQSIDPPMMIDMYFADDGRTIGLTSVSPLFEQITDIRLLAVFFEQGLNNFSDSGFVPVVPYKGVTLDKNEDLFVGEWLRTICANNTDPQTCQDKNVKTLVVQYTFDGRQYHAEGIPNRMAKGYLSGSVIQDPFKSEGAGQ